MTREQLDAIRDRVEAATRGPWESVTPKRYAAVRSDADGCYIYTQGKIPADTHPDTVARQQRDAQFIAHAREDVPALLAEVERLTVERDALKSKASTVCTFLMPSGQWSWFVTPGPLAASLVTHPTRREAEEAAEAHAERAGWPRVDRFNCQAEALDVSVERDSFRRGVSAMREAAAHKVASYTIKVMDPFGNVGTVVEDPMHILVAEIRALPDPEDK